MAIPWTVTVNDGVNPLDHVYVWISTDAAGAAVVTGGYTGVLGTLLFSLDPATLYFWKDKSGYSFTNPETVAVALPGTGSTSSGTTIPAGVATNSYGTPSEVAALVPRYANGVGTFLTTDRPALGQVIVLINQVSSLINGILSQQGFVIPVTQADVKLSLDMFVEEEVAAIAEGINGSGRFGPTTKQPGKSRFTLIMDDIDSFVLSHADGWEAMGATRSRSAIGEIGYRDVDQGGDAIVPIFERKAFENAFEEWDT
jgi:hypothetical protein